MRVREPLESGRDGGGGDGDRDADGAAASEATAANAAWMRAGFGVGEDVGADEALHGRQEGATTARTEAMRRYWRGCGEAASVEEAAERGAWLWLRATTWASFRKPSDSVVGPHLPKTAVPNRLNL